MPSVTVVACAGQDKTLSVWNTSVARPFVITQELATKSISDLAWSPDGETLYISSLDGGIMAAVFEPGELGFPAPLQENEKVLTKYGAGRKAGIMEGVDALLLEESSKAGELKGVQGRMGELMGDGGLHPAPTVNGGPEMARPNGTSALPAVPATNGSTQANGHPEPDPQKTLQEQKVQQLKSRVEIVNGKKRIKPLLISSSSNVAETSNIPQPQLVSTSTAQGARPPADAPASILDVSKPYDGLPKGGLAALLVGNKRKYAEIEGDEDRRIEKRLGAAVRNSAAPVVLNSADGLIPPSLAARNEHEIPPALRPAIPSPALTVSQIRLAIPVLRSVIVRAVDEKLGPRPDAAATAATDEEMVLLEARNATGPSRTGRPHDRDPSRINCSRRGQSMWQDYLPRPVLLLTGNQNFWAAACDDGSLYVWTPAGRRLLSAMVIEANPVIMDCRGWFLMCISAVGLVRVWDLQRLCSVHDPVSLGPCLDIAATSQGPHLTPSPSIIFARLNSKGMVVVAMSNGDGYTYSNDMKVWMRLSEPWWAVGSQYWSTTDATSVGKSIGGSSAKAQKDVERNDMVHEENLSAGIIPLLERNTTSQAQIRGRSYFLQKLIKALLVAEGFEGFEANVSIAHLENRVAAAMTLGAREEFKIYLLMYAKRLGAEGLKGKIEELLRTLLGDIFTEEIEEDGGAPSKIPLAQPQEQLGKGWYASGDEICGWKRKDLLREVVLVLGMVPFGVPPPGISTMFCYEFLY